MHTVYVLQYLSHNLHRFKNRNTCFQDLQDRYRRLERRYNEVEDNRAALEHDLHSLVTVISIAGSC